MTTYEKESARTLERIERLLERIVRLLEQGR